MFRSDTEPIPMIRLRPKSIQMDPSKPSGRRGKGANRHIELLGTKRVRSEDSVSNIRCLLSRPRQCRCCSERTGSDDRAYCLSSLKTGPSCLHLEDDGHRIGCYHQECQDIRWHKEWCVLDCPRHRLDLCELRLQRPIQHPLGCGLGPTL